MKSILSLFTLFTVIWSFGQVEISNDFTYTISDPYRVVDGKKHYFSKGDEVLAVKYGRGIFHFQKFSGDKLNESKHIEIDKTTGFTPESYRQVNDKFYFFYSIWDKANQNEQLFVREIDFDNCTFVDEGRLLIKVDGKVTGGFGFSLFGSDHIGGGKFHFETSYDESRLIVQYRLKPKERRDALNKDVIGMHVYSSDLDETWSKQVEMPYTEKKMNNLGYTIDKDANTYVLAEVYKDNTTKRKTKSGEPNYRLELIKISGDDQSISISEVELEDKFITDVGFFEGKNKEIIIAGFYGNRFARGTDGFFLCKVDNDGGIADQVSYEIPVDVMKLYMSQRKQAKMERKDERKDLSMSHMVLRDIVFDDDGITLFGEKYFVIETRDPRTGQVTRTYYYQEILVARIDNEGELLWMNKLPKNQSGAAQRGGMGFYTLPGDNVDYVLFLDNVKNIELPLDRYPKRHADGAGGFLTGFRLDRETGNVEKISILNTRNAKGIALYQFHTGRIVKISDTEFAVECYKKKKEDVMIKVTMTRD